MRACVFVDGENLRLAIGDLYADHFDKRDYLPKNADWGELYDMIVYRATENAGKRLRTYWYVVGGVNSYPEPLKNWERTEENIKEWRKRNHRVLKSSIEKELFSYTEKEQIDRLRELQDELYKEGKKISNRFNGFTNLQNGISKKHHAIEFRRSGDISYNVIERQLGKEKTVDVNLAVDMVTLSDNYDLAIIVSGDQDFVPAAQAVKNMGKQVVNVAFKARNGNLLPGGAKQLNQTADWSVVLGWDEFRKILKLDGQSST